MKREFRVKIIEVADGWKVTVKIGNVELDPKTFRRMSDVHSYLRGAISAK